MVSVALPRVVGLLVISAVAAALIGCGQKPAAVSPAPTSTSIPTPAGTSYTRDANGVLELLASNSSNAADVMGKADPASAAWRATLGARLDALAQVDAQARALKPAPSDADVHQRLLEITADFSRAAQLIRTGFDPVNVDNLDQAGQILNVGVTKVAALRATMPTQ